MKMKSEMRVLGMFNNFLFRYFLAIVNERSFEMNEQIKHFVCF